METPDLVFSLGPGVRVAWNLRDYFGFDRAYPFDWWNTPAKSMLALLDPSRPFEVSRDDLVVTQSQGGTNSVYNRRLNLLHHHDFDRDGPLLRPLTDAAIARFNAKYSLLFNRLWTGLAAAERPLAVLGGISRGWTHQTPDGGNNPALNGGMEPQALVDAIRARLGSPLRVLIVEIGGPEKRQALDGGWLMRLPDANIRHGLPRGQSYAEPVEVFRQAFAALGLRPGSLPLAEDGPDMMISNNTPRVRRA